MLAIEKLIWVTHSVRDVQTRIALEKFYLDIFAAQTFWDARPVQGLERDETLILIGKLMIIPIAPMETGSGIGRLLVQNGHRFLAIALKVPDVKQADAHLARHGMKRVYFDPVFYNTFFWTDGAESCHTPYEICQVEMPNDLRLRPSWSPDWWRDEHPLGIEKLSSVATVVRDLDAAKKFYRDVFEFKPLHERIIESEGAKVAAFWASDFIFEVMQTMGKGTLLDDYLVKYPDGGVYSVNFKVKSPPKAAEYLKSKGLRLVGDPRSRFSIDPRDAFGAVFTFVGEELPNDPRAR